MTETMEVLLGADRSISRRIVLRAQPAADYDSQSVADDFSQPLPLKSTYTLAKRFPTSSRLFA